MGGAGLLDLIGEAKINRKTRPVGAKYYTADCSRVRYIFDPPQPPLKKGGVYLIDVQNAIYNR